MIDLLIKKPVLLRTPFSFLFYLPFDKRDDEKKKKEKKLPKIFGRYMIKFLPLHPLSEKKKRFKKKRSLRNLHKQYK